MAANPWILCYIEYHSDAFDQFSFCWHCELVYRSSRIGILPCILIEFQSSQRECNFIVHFNILYNIVDNSVVKHNITSFLYNKSPHISGNCCFVKFRARKDSNRFKWFILLVVHIHIKQKEFYLAHLFRL